MMRQTRRGESTRKGKQAARRCHEHERAKEVGDRLFRRASECVCECECKGVHTTLQASNRESVA